MPKVIRWMRCTSMPHTWATSRLWDTARIALPSRVDRRNTKAPTVIAMAKAQAASRDFERANGPEHEGAGQVLDRAQVGREGELGQVHQRDRDAEGEQERRQLGRVDHAAHQEALQPDADQEEERHRDQQGEVRD